MVQTYDAASRLIDRTTGSGTESYTYDANGNMIWLVADGKESAYTWNKENMLVNVVYKGTPETGFEFTYNAFNQRVMESESARVLVSYGMRTSFELELRSPSVRCGLFRHCY